MQASLVSRYRCVFFSFCCISRLFFPPHYLQAAWCLATGAFFFPLYLFVFPSAKNLRKSLPPAAVAPSEVGSTKPTKPHTHTHTHTHTSKYIHTTHNTHTHKWGFYYWCIQALLRAGTEVASYTSSLRYIYIYIRIYIHTYIHTYIRLY